MHELAIADAILAIVTEHADGRRVNRIDVEIGHLRQVVPAALEFAFALLAQDSLAEEAELVLHEMPVRARCRRCAATSPQPSFPLRCPECGALDPEIVSGEELSVGSIEVTDGQLGGADELCATSNGF